MPISELRPTQINDIEDVARTLNEIIAKINELVRVHNEAE